MYIFCTALDCANPSNAASVDSFKAACTAEGRKALCCTIPAATLGVLCNPVIG